MLAWLTILPAPIHAAQAEIKDLSINGGIQDGKAKLIIEAQLAGLTGDKDRLLYATALNHTLHIARDKHTHTVNAVFDILQGDPKELTLTMAGEGEIKTVKGDNLQDWSVRQETNGVRSLVLRPRKMEKPVDKLNVTITAERELRVWSNPVKPLAFGSPLPALFQGYLKVETTPELSALATNSVGLVPIEAKFLPETLRTVTKPDEAEPLAFRFHGAAYSLPLFVTLSDPEARRVVLRDFKLEGQLKGDTASFTLSAMARVKNPRGASIVLLSGGVALAELERNPDWRLRFDNGQFWLVFDQPGDYPVKLKFNAAVQQNAGWSRVDFRVAPAAMQPIALAGLAADTQFEFAGAARPERSGGDFKSHLPPDGAVKLAWKQVKPEEEGKLFYAAEMLEQIIVRPGQLLQVFNLEGKVIQGEMSRMTLLVRGASRLTQVEGAYGTTVLAWNVESVPGSTDRRLHVQFNQPQKGSFALQLSTQAELGAFPQTMEVAQVAPEGATRFAGHVRVVNDGAVRLEVVQATGLSQISPEAIPRNDKAGLIGTSGNQVFAYRFSTPDFTLRVNADNVLPEVGVSQLLAYHLGETELAIDGEFELDIREAPLREVVLRVPRGFALSGLSAAGLSDYFLTEPAGQADAELRLVYGAPIADRQVIQLRLERNVALGQPAWTLPRVEVLKAKSTRGHIAVSADTGFRLTPERTVALTDIATAFFPRKLAGIQAAFRLSEPAWEAALRVERLPQSIQADVFHLFSIGEGIAYGSSTINFSIAGAPVSQFLVALSDEYFNVEFTGKDLRSNWQRTTNGYLVTLNTPVSGAYTLLATYERPFKARGDTLAFTGARPLDAQSEQGHTLVVSAYQFQVKPTDVSPGLLPLETAEVPAEYRLFFDAPILAAYRYTARPFNLQLALTPLAQGETVSLVVDRAVLATRISKDGEVLTDVRYFVKNRGNPHLRLTLPAGVTLWSATVNGATVVPVKDGGANLIPLPQRVDPNTVQQLDLKLASRSQTPSRVTAHAPVVGAPVLLAEWKLEPDTAQRLVYRDGSLKPAEGIADVSGFVGLSRLLRHHDAPVQLALLLALTGFAVWAWRWATRAGTHRYSVRHLGGSIVGLVAVLLAGVIGLGLIQQAGRQQQTLPGSLSFLAPVQQSGSALSVEVANVPSEATVVMSLADAWPALAALLVWGYTLVSLPRVSRPVGFALGWTLLAWAALRWPNGAVAFLWLLLAFLAVQVLLPAVRGLFQLPQRPDEPDQGTPAAATLSLLLGGLLWLGLGNVAQAIPVESQRVERADISFPLTPALSLGEREGRSQRLVQSNTAGSSRSLIRNHFHAEASEWRGARIGELSLLGNEAGRAQIAGERDNAHPLPEGEGRGEGEGSKNISTSATFARRAVHPSLGAGRNSGPAITRQGMRHAFLQGAPDGVADGLSLAAQAGVPEAQHLDPLPLQLGVARGILEPLSGQAMPVAVQFEVERGLDAEEIKDVLTEGVLSAELVGGEPAVTQPAPEEFFCPGVMLAQRAGDAGELPRGHGGIMGEVGAQAQVPWQADVSFPLTPALSLGEREAHAPRVAGRDITGAANSAAEHRAKGSASNLPEARTGDLSQRGVEAEGKGISSARDRFLPLPQGEGWGEGEGNVNEPKVMLLAQAAPATRPPTKAADAPSTVAIPARPIPANEAAIAESVAQDIRVEDKFVLATAKIRWHATKGQMLPVLLDPAVLTRIVYPTNGLTLVQTYAAAKRTHQVIAQADGSYDLEVQYQLHVTEKNGVSGFDLPTQHGLVNRLTLTLPDLDVDVSSPTAVSVQRDANVTNATVTTLVLAPAASTWINWKPRSRDVKREKAVFFVETFQLYAPAAGVIEGVHQVHVRPAQGELGELVLEVPAGMTISDVLDAFRAGVVKPQANQAAPPSLVSLWRFDPDTRRLRVSLAPAQSRPFTLFVRSQIATGPLPFEHGVGLLTVEGASGQLDSLGIATGSEVQLDNVAAQSLSPINLEDFSGAPLLPLRAQIAGLTLRRAFRSTESKGTVTLKAAAVEPDVRVETQETLSLSEDRTLLAVNATMTVTRAGIFRVSFVLPAGLDVESISGAALSHWTELKTDAGRIITLHLKGKTEGQHPFSVNLTGPGLKAAKGVAVPRVAFREAGKQRGQLVIVPEQGMRLQVAARDGVTQLDPQKSGIRQKGVLAFRLLQADWNLSLDLEQVDAWVQVTGLQHVNVSEAQAKVAANLQYQIENTGLKALRVLVPANAEGVRFRGEQVADFLPVAGAVTNGLQTWEVKLHRRIIGRYLLQATWQEPVGASATNTVVRGVQAGDANLQRGFVTVQSDGRLQVRADAPPAALQPAEWQSIPRPLLQDIPAATANHTFRLVEPGYQLALRLERHEAAKLLPARVNSVTLSSVISDEGVMLTQVKLDIVPGDLRLLNFSLPPGAEFWFAFVNQKGVWPWRDRDFILVPLEQQSRTDKPTSVELFYASRIGSPAGGRLDLALFGPKFDLPLENITWQVYLNDKWRLNDWRGTLQLQEDTRVAQSAAVDVQSYLQNEFSQNRERTKAAEEMLNLGNTFLERGDPQQARRAFQSAFGLSAHDQAFNEDARVQLHNLKLQQALIGLNVRQSAAAGEAAPAPGNLKELRNRKDVAYTQQEAKQVMDANTADDNAALLRLAERIVQQQDAAVPNPTAISASIPQQGRLLTFRRTVQVDTRADLSLALKVDAAQTVSAGVRYTILGLLFAGFALAAWLGRKLGEPRQDQPA